MYLLIYVFIYTFISVLGIEPRTFCMLDKHYKLYSQTLAWILEGM
jgi:hypothetical protein